MYFSSPKEENIIFTIVYLSIKHIRKQQHAVQVEQIMDM